MSIYSDLLGAEIRRYKTAHFTTRVIEAGAGTPLFLMHGGGGHAEAYSRNIVRLATVCHPLAMDFIWHGLSSAPPFREGNWCGQFTDQVLELMDEIGAERAIFEGESLGGWVAMDMGINHPDRVEKLVLNTAWGMKTPGYKQNADLASLRKTSIDALRNPTPELIRKRLQWLMPLGGVTEELVDIRLALWSRTQTRNALIEYYERLFAPECEDLLFRDEDLAKIKAPTLLLWTEENPIAGPEEAKRLQKIIPNSQLFIVEGAAHWPQWECAELHDEVVMKFITS